MARILCVCALIILRRRWQNWDQGGLVTRTDLQGQMDARRGCVWILRLTSGALSWQSHHQMPLRKSRPWLRKCKKRQTDVFLTFQKFYYKEIWEKRWAPSRTFARARKQLQTTTRTQTQTKPPKPRTLYDKLHICSQVFLINRQKSLLAILNRRTYG